MKSILNEIKNTYGYSDYEIALIKYVIISIASEFSKLLLLGFYYIYIGKLGLYIFSFTLLLLLRVNSGGYHCKHYLSCLALTFAISFLSIVLLPIISIPNYSIIIAVLLVCMVTNYIIGPVASPFRPTPDMYLLKSCNNNSFAVTLFFIIIVSIFNTNKFMQPYLIVGFWTTVLHTVQLIIAKLREKYKCLRKFNKCLRWHC